MSDCAILYSTACSRDIALVNFLRACAKNKDLHETRRLHAEILTKGLLQQNVYVSSSLLNAYVKCSALAIAQQVFDEVFNRNVICWNVLIAGYTQHDHSDKALLCFQRMSMEGYSPDAFTFACMLKACGSLGEIDKGKELHDDIVRRGLFGDDNILGTALVDMYAKCGCLAKAEEVFNTLRSPDVVSWTALITCYCQHGRGEHALICYEKMQILGASPNAITFACILKACGSSQLIEVGVKIHCEIARKGLAESDHVLKNALVDMYAKCGALSKAMHIFNNLAVRNVVSWTALIVGLTLGGFGEKALLCYDRMWGESVHPDIIAFSHILQACGDVGALKKGREIHTEILLLENHRLLANALLDMYAKCGSVTSAHKVFDRLIDKDLVSWNSLIAGYSNQSLGEEALSFYDQMREKEFSPNAVTYGCTLHACASVGAVQKGQELHAEIARAGFLKKNCVLGNSLIDMYAKCGAIAKAQEVFDELINHDVISWNTLIAGYMHVGRHSVIFNLLNKLTKEGLEPSPVTYILALNVCSQLGLVKEGQHYFDTICSSHGVIETLEHRALMVELLGRAGLFDKAMALMPPCSYLPAWFSLLRASQFWVNVKLGLLAFEQIVILDSKFTKAYICMSNIYAAADMQEDAESMLARAQDLLDLENEDVSSCNALIASYCMQGHAGEALKLFAQMEVDGHFSNTVTFLSILKACAAVGAMVIGERIHNEMAQRGLLDSNDFGTALVHMYSKCGDLLKAQELFHEFQFRDVISWTALLAGYCQWGQGKEVLDCFERMKCESVAPDELTFYIILKACCALRAASKGQLYYTTLSMSYTTNFKHHACLIDFLLWAGQWRKVMEIARRNLSHSFSFGGAAMLGACWKWGNEKAYQDVFDAIGGVHMAGKSHEVRIVACH